MHSRPKRIVLTSSGCGHTSVNLCINGVSCGIRKYSTMIINNQKCFSLHDVSLVAHMYLHTMEQHILALSKGTITIAIA